MSLLVIVYCCCACVDKENCLFAKYKQFATYKSLHSHWMQMQFFANYKFFAFCKHSLLLLLVVVLYNSTTQPPPTITTNCLQNANNLQFTNGCICILQYKCNHLQIANSLHFANKQFVVHKHSNQQPQEHNRKLANPTNRKKNK